MNTTNPSDGINGFVQCTTDAVDITTTTQNIIERHMQYLPYPNENFHDKCEDISIDQEDDQYPLQQIYLRSNKIFLSHHPVEVVNIEAERIYNPIGEFLNPYLYTITIRYGSMYEWTIKRRYKHFHELHQSLLHYIKSEFKKSRQDSHKHDENNDENHKLIQQQQPRFPTQNDRIAFINEFSIRDRCKVLQTYLNKVLKHPIFREHIAMRLFLEISPLSFVRGLGKSFREGYLFKRSNDDYRGRSIFIRMLFQCNPCKLYHDQKWFVIKDSYFVYIQLDSALIGFPMLIDQEFNLDRRFRKTRTKKGIQIKNSQRRMIIKCQRDYERDHWFNSLMEIKNKSIFTQQHLFESFAPKRQKQYAQWFINGQSYMEALAKAILSAREEIFISDWWLSPEIRLIRPFQDDSMQLDNLLGKRAEEGVRVYVLLFKDIIQVVGLNSLHSKRKLVGKSPNKKNIKVIRHPDHRILPGTESSFLYSHHEKTVVIDQRIAFIGGIDLCWGRWDTDDYRLVDLSDENVTELKLPEQLADQPKEESAKEEAAVETTTEMSKNTISTSLFGDANDKQEESNDASNKNSQQDENVIEPIGSRSNNTEKKLHNESKWQRIFKRNKRNDSDDSSADEQDTSASDEKPKTIVGVTPVVDDKTRFFLGKDYSNYYEKDFEFVEKFDEDYIDRKLSPRMPWHDEVLVVSGEAARDCARHFIQRWNIHKADKFRFKEAYPYLLPKTYDDQELSDKSFLQSILPNDRSPICIDAQCVRSASFWSCGINNVERSVQNAYIHMIDNAEHFIYIENQFFVTIAEDTSIKNDIGNALYRRIIRAHINKEKFRIFIFLPLLPGFANSNAVQAELYFIMRSINKGETSLYQRLIRDGVSNPEEYLTFYGMRNWDILMGSLVTEIIYVHSKLMIVDDRMCICGSANLNDRSMQGTRDSEVCLVVNDIEMVDSYLNGKLEKVGMFCSTWRKKLFRQILGIKNEEEVNIDDPCSDEFYEYFRRIAKTNTDIYEEVFNSIPTNKIRKFVDVEPYKEKSKLKETDPKTAHEKCKQIQGFIVEFPIDFLADDMTMPKWTTSEGMAPISLWT